MFKKFELVREIKNKTDEVISRCNLLKGEIYDREALDIVKTVSDTLRINSLATLDCCAQMINEINQGVLRSDCEEKLQMEVYSLDYLESMLDIAEIREMHRKFNSNK